MKWLGMVSKLSVIQTNQPTGPTPHPNESGLAKLYFALKGKHQVYYNSQSLTPDFTRYYG